MAEAILGLRLNDDNDTIITLENGPLEYIDNITRNFVNEELLKKDEEFLRKIKAFSPLEIDSSKVVLHYIKNNNEKVELKILYNDSEPIRSTSRAIDEYHSETERARKLLFSSKNKSFIKLFMKNKTLARTAYSTVKISVKEYKRAKQEGLNVFVKDEEYRMPIIDVFKYHLNHKKLGDMRLLLEDSLEVWKNNIQDLAREDLYFYSRELRLLINEYDYKKIPRRQVCNLNLNFKKIETFGSVNINRINSGNISKTTSLPKRKILEDRKAS